MGAASHLDQMLQATMWLTWGAKQTEAEVAALGQRVLHLLAQAQAMELSVLLWHKLATVLHWLMEEGAPWSCPSAAHQVLRQLLVTLGEEHLEDVLMSSHVPALSALWEEGLQAPDAEELAVVLQLLLLLTQRWRGGARPVEHWQLICTSVSQLDVPQLSEDCAQMELQLWKLSIEAGLLSADQLCSYGVHLSSVLQRGLCPVPSPAALQLATTWLETSIPLQEPAAKAAMQLISHLLQSAEQQCRQAASELLPLLLRKVTHGDQETSAETRCQLLQAAVRALHEPPLQESVCIALAEASSTDWNFLSTLLKQAGFATASPVYEQILGSENTCNGF